MISFRPAGFLAKLVYGAQCGGSRSELFSSDPGSESNLEEVEFFCGAQNFPLMPVFCLNLYPNLNQNENRDQDPSRNVRIRRTADAARDSVSMF